MSSWIAEEGCVVHTKNSVYRGLIKLYVVFCFMCVIVVSGMCYLALILWGKSTLMLLELLVWYSQRVRVGQDGMHPDQFVMHCQK